MVLLMRRIGSHGRWCMSQFLAQKLLAQYRIPSMSWSAASHIKIRPWMDGRSTHVFSQSVGAVPSSSADGSAHQYLLAE